MKQATHRRSAAAPVTAPAATVRLGPMRSPQRAPQRGSCACGGGCPRCRGQGAVRKKSRVSQPRDAAEREADSVAERISSATRGASPAVHNTAPTAQPTATEPPRAWVRDTPPGAELPDAVRAPLAYSGQPLTPVVRDDLSTRFGVDLSAVRIHADAAAAQSAAALRAHAYTVGNHIVFGAHRYAPHDHGGLHLLAHELTHAVQQQREGAQDAKAPPISRRPADVNRNGPGSSGVHRVTMTCGGTIDFETDEGLLQYPLQEPCDMPVGEFDPTVTVTGDDVHFDFGDAEVEGAEGSRFDFRYRIEPGQPNPSTLFDRSGDTVPFTILPANEYGYSVQFNVRLMTPEEFTEFTGLDAAALPENTPVPVAASGGPAGETPLLDLTGQTLPVATGTSGLLAISPISLVPSNSTGVLFSPGHVSFFANPGGDLTVRGFRASLFTHTMADLGPGAIGDTHAERLWRGTAGRFRNDWMFGQLAPQTVLYTPRDTDAASLFAEHLRGTRYDETYRFSPPRPDAPPGSREFRIGERIYGTTRDPSAVLCTRNCITVPVAEWEGALGLRPTLNTPEGPLDLITGEYARGETDPYRAGRVRDLAEFTRSPEVHGPGGEVRVSTFTPAAGRAFTAIKVGGTIMLVYGVVTTTERLAEAYGTPEFGGVVAEETGMWTGGILGSALGTAAGGAIFCSPTGPVDLVCIAGGFVLGALGGLIFGTAGGATGRALYESSGGESGGASRTGIEYLGQGLYLDHDSGRAYLGPGPKM